MLPRVTFDVTGQDLLAVFQRPGAVASMLGREAQRRGFDGWVSMQRRAGSGRVTPVLVALARHPGLLLEAQGAAGVHRCMVATVRHGEGSAHELRAQPPMQPRLAHVQLHVRLPARRHPLDRPPFNILLPAPFHMCAPLLPPCLCQVVEAWSLWATMGVTQHPQAREAALGLLKRLAAVLAQAGKRLVLAVAPLRPPLGQPAQLTEADAEELLAFVDALSGG